ncbi:hypothetical protein HHL28_17870 [Aerophototrophica crusticola]|uniref:Uncharacterized protein n=1 Tax=Aerophototrophica crusticola TaxID=1709002 RepID=A0A858RB99_9PROT|nr:hypothetical protein HHL28_17870 [Rhodospirillaceae bacterium B3]
MSLELEAWGPEGPNTVERRRADGRPGDRVARLAWLELAAAATRRALALEIRAEQGSHGKG